MMAMAAPTSSGDLTDCSPAEIEEFIKEVRLLLTSNMTFTSLLSPLSSLLSPLSSLLHPFTFDALCLYCPSPQCYCFYVITLRCLHQHHPVHLHSYEM